MAGEQAPKAPRAQGTQAPRHQGTQGTLRDCRLSGTQRRLAGAALKSAAGPLGPRPMTLKGPASASNLLSLLSTQSRLLFFISQRPWPSSSGAFHRPHRIPRQNGRLSQLEGRHMAHGQVAPPAKPPLAPARTPALSLVDSRSMSPITTSNPRVRPTTTPRDTRSKLLLNLRAMRLVFRPPTPSSSILIARPS
ncbi:hypothetical protein CC78DRAFT_582391 [Lojkania enalia]|uniref:Uncharacterized protein n=1 Tax=Lojkania enalia TaxID=147567 RepID=A0A9P4K6C2_9PLEO|nr:hypothetical protein CC78DRAFT_582391 [Didymosphaeria enalia]